jgi:hypothetical protein
MLTQQTSPGTSQRRCDASIKTNLREMGCDIWSGFIWLRIGQVVGSSEHDNDPSGCIKGREFLD